MDYKDIIKFDDYRGIFPEQVEKPFNLDDPDKPCKVVSIGQKGEHLLRIIFAPNPKSGFPDSSLAMYYNMNVAPEVRDFIGQTLLKPMNALKGTSDELAMQSIKGRAAQYGEELDGYIHRLQDMVNETSDISEASDVNADV